MGMGGFHVHVRVGLENEYLADEFMSLIAYYRERENLPIRIKNYKMNNNIMKERYLHGI